MQEHKEAAFVRVLASFKYHWTNWTEATLKNYRDGFHLTRSWDSHNWRRSRIKWQLFSDLIIIFDTTHGT